MERSKSFFINDIEYIFDGNNVDIIVGGENLSSYSKQPRMLNSHRVSHLKTLCLILNNSCNLNCSYCFTNKGMYNKPYEQMSFETAKQAISTLIESAQKNNSNKITLSFFGGEPLLSFELIKKCVYFIENIKLDISCDYMITANGTLFTPEIVEFMQKYNFDVMISIDGTKKLHNYYRKYINNIGSYDDVIKAIKLFKDKKCLNARITITDINTNIHSYIDNILDLGIERITFAVDYNISNKSFFEFIESLKLLINKYYEDILNQKYYDVTNFSTIITTLALHQRKLTFCNAGISYLTVSADGKFYRYPRFVGNDNFSISASLNYDDTIEEVKKFKKRLKESPTNRNRECNKCVYAYICGGMCYHHSIMDGKSEFENVPLECFQRKLIFDSIIELICKLPAENRRKLLLYYTHLWKSIKRR